MVTLHKILDVSWSTKIFHITKGVNMQINFILFKMLIEKYSRWSNLKVSRDEKEYIIDFGYWRFFIY